jgi:hypothetical protein
MAVRATWELDCDRPGCGKAFQAPFQATFSQAAIRRAAREEGWHTKTAGKTYCPDHKPNGAKGMGACRVCGDVITLVRLDDRGVYVPSVNGDTWINVDEESVCAPHEDNCSVCKAGGHNHERG